MIGSVLSLEVVSAQSRFLINQTIIMRKISSILAVLMLFSAMAFGQNRTVIGTVINEKGDLVSGASIKIKGTRNGAATDNNGQFRLSAKKGDILIVTGVNFSNAEVVVGDGPSVQINVKSIVVTGTEIVVTALGIRRSEKSLGYAVSKVDPNVLLQKSEPDVLKGLQGKVPGVDIRTSQGTPGAATRIQIRGNSTFSNGDAQPLIVVDGVPYSNETLVTSSQTSGGTAYGSGIANLDPNDIESMNVLKGTAASALYGSRGARGVIVITTKSGSAKKGVKPLNINFRSSYSTEKIANLPDYQNTYGTGAQFRYSNSNGSWGPRFGLGNVYDGGGSIIRQSSSGVDSLPAWPEYLGAYPELFDANGRMAYVAQPNNVKDLFRTGAVYENSIGLNGGDANNSFALTVSNLVHNGYVENTSYNKNNIGLGGQTKYKGLTVGANFSFAKSKQVGGFFGENQVGGATSQFARTLFLGRNWNLGLPYQDALGKPLIPNGGAQFDNPRWAAINNVATTEEERIVAGIRLNYKVNNWISASYNFGINNTSIGRDEITQEFSRAADGLGRIVVDNFESQEMNSTFILNFTPKINEDFAIDFKLGNDVNQRSSRRQANTGLDFVVPGIYNLINTATQSFSADEKFKRRFVAFFADATFSYRNYAFINASVRNDRTSTLPYENASYYYPGLSASLVFTDALKIKSRFLDYGKLRVGWAKVGNDAPPNRGQDVFLINQNFLGQPSTSLSALTIDSKLTPEFTKEVEAGIDLSFLNKKVRLDFTVYNKISTNLIYPISVASSVGYANYNTNVGEISNKGVEIGLTLTPINTVNLSWEIRGAFTRNRNFVNRLPDGLERAVFGGGFADGIQSYLEPGMPFGYLRGNKADRASDGSLLINPATGMVIESLTPGMIGDPNPDYKLGITNTISYKGFVLSGLFDMTKGGDMYSVTVSSLLGRGVTKANEDRETNWIIPGVYGDVNSHEAIAGADGKQIPNQTRITTNDLYFAPGGASSTFGINASDEFNIYDATVYRLREVTLGYNLPKKMISNLGIGGVRLSISGRNLWYLAPNVPKHTNFDPEVGSYGASAVQGFEFSAAPTTRRYGVNINVTF